MEWQSRVDEAEETKTNLGTGDGEREYNVGISPALRYAQRRNLEILSI